MSGYEEARFRADSVTRALQDIALLLGAQADEPVSLDTGGEIVPGLGALEDAATLEARARDLREGMFKIIVLGEFKNGKSTLLNGMLGNKTLPAKAAPATAIITVLVYGESDEVAIYESGGSLRLVTWEEFVQEFQLTRDDQETLEEHGTVDRFRDIEYAQVSCRHPICANGVKLIDSPGLGEHISRTRVSTNFLKQSHAAIFVLNATRILGRDEREFIESVLGSGRLGHVFFVVNRINQVDPSGAREVREWVREGLRRHFLDDRGEFDEDFYRRRVFFVDARGALEARMAQPVDEQRLMTTGVPELERELERFLTGEDKIAAVLQSTLGVLRPIVNGARERIAQQKAALDQPLAELEARRAESERRLSELEEQNRDIERTIHLFADTIQSRVYANLLTYIDEMHERWDEDSRRLIDLDAPLSMRNLLTSYMQPEVKEEMAEALGEQVQRYLQLSFEAWAEHIPAVLEADINRMMAEVEARVDDLQLELDEIAALFAGRPPAPTVERREVGARLLHTALTLSDIYGVTDEAMALDDWNRMIGRMAQQAVIVFVVGTFLTGGNFLIALVIVEAVHLGLHESELKKRIRGTLGDRLHENLREQVEARKAFIQGSIRERFSALATTVTEVTRKSIGEVRTEQERIIAQKQNQQFSVEAEKARLDAIDDKLSELLGLVQATARSGGSSVAV